MIDDLEQDNVKGPYSRVFNEMWASASFRSVSERARYLFFYLLTGPETSALPGVVRASMASMAHDLEWSLETTEQHFHELTEAGMAIYDPAGMVWLPNGLRFNAPINQSVVKAWAHTWRKIPACPLKAHVYDRLRAHCARRGQSWLTAFESGCRRPTVSGRLDTDKPQKPAARHNARHDAAHHGDHDAGHDGRHLQLHQASVATTKENQNSAPAARALACTHEGSTTNPPEPTSAHEPPPSAKTAPCAIRDDEDDPTGPMTSRGASLPLFRPTADHTPPAPSPAPEATTPTTPEPPVVVLAPEPCPAPPPTPVSPAPVETVAPVTPAPSPSAVASGEDFETLTPASTRAEIRQVFAHWSAVLWSNPAIPPKLNKVRFTRIKARLAEGYTVADLCLAIDGTKHDPWLMGTKDGAPPEGFKDIKTVLRDGAQVERLAGLARANAPKPPSTPRPLAERLNDLAPLTAAQQRFIDEGNARPLPPHLAHIRDMSPAEMLRAWNAGQLGCSNGAPSPRKVVARA